MKWREEIIGDCRLILGDCRDILPTLGKAYAQPDLFIAPPSPQAKQEAFDGL